MISCKEPGCDGEVDLTKPYPLQTNCVFYDSAYPCKKCGRLYWDDGAPVFNRRDQKAFLINGEVVLEKKEPISEQTES